LNCRFDDARYLGSSIIAARGLCLTIANPALAEDIGWHAYGNTHPVKSSSSSWKCVATKTVDTNLLAQVCAVRLSNPGRPFRRPASMVSPRREPAPTKGDPRSTGHTGSSQTTSLDSAPRSPRTAPGSMPMTACRGWPVGRRARRRACATPGLPEDGRSPAATPW
jgi:hypothetical protein